MKKLTILFTILLVTCFYGYSQELTVSVRLKLKPQKDSSYKATEDLEMKALVLKHGVLNFKQACPGDKNPELLLYYNLSVKRSMSKQDRAQFIRDFWRQESLKTRFTNIRLLLIPV